MIEIHYFSYSPLKAIRSIACLQLDFSLTIPPVLFQASVIANNDFTGLTPLFNAGRVQGLRAE